MAALSTSLLVAGATVGGAALSSRASGSAARTVSQSTDRAADLQNQQFQQLLALQMPGFRRGEAAGNLYSAALGIPSMTGRGNMAGSMPVSAINGAPFAGMMTGNNASTIYSGPGDLAPFVRQDQFNFENRPEPTPFQTAQFGQAQQVQEQPLTQQTIADMVRQTPGFQAQLDQGIRAIDRAAPLVGGMYSGRRMKALNDYGQQTFGSFYNDWMNRVGGLAGQGQQVAQNVGAAGMQNAANVGNLMMQGANARAQGSMNSASAWSGAIGTGLGMFGGSRGWF